MIFKVFKKTFLEIFSFSRSELRGVAVLMTILIMVLSARIWFGLADHGISFSVEKLAQQNKQEEPYYKKVNYSSNKHASKHLHVFNPNTIDYKELLELGLNKDICRQIINYRNKGGHFYKSADLLNIYSIDSTIYRELKPYLNIPSESNKMDKHKKYHINLNTADTNEIKLVPGLGSILSERIIKYRNLLGGFYSLSQLKEVYGVNDSLYNNISSYFYADTNQINHIVLNKCKYDDLTRHPYINNYQAKAILSFKKLSGKYTDKKQLLDNYLVPDETYVKLAPYLALN